MPLPWLKEGSRLTLAILGMVKLAWRAAPLCFTGLLLIQLMQGLVPLATAWLTKTLFDLLTQNIQSGAPSVTFQGLLPLLIAQAIVTIISQLTTPSNMYLNAELQRRLSLDVQTTVYQKINSLSGLAPFEDSEFYDTIQLAVRGAEFGSSQALHTFMTLIQSAVTLIGFLSVLAHLNPFLTAIVCLTVLPQLYVQLRVGRQRFGLTTQNNLKERRASYYGYVLSGLQYAKELRIFNLADYFLEAFKRTWQAVHHAQRRQHVRELRWQIVLATVASAVSSGAFVIVVFEAFAGQLSLGDVTLYASAVVSVQTGLTGVVLALASLSESALFFSHYENLLARPQPLLSADSVRPVPPLEVGIELRGVSFRYSDQHPWVLRNVNLCIPANQCVALVGLNGAGKTTLVKLLTRLYDPTEGLILWNGIDIRSFEPTELRQHVGAIFQDFVHYDLSVQENIGLGNVTHVEDTACVREAAMEAGVHNTIVKLPKGYQTILSRWLAGNELAGDLSGGEWQKIALARMFIRKADLLILDEPTAALDAQAEYEVYSRFTKLVVGRTSLLITHRFSTVRMADVVAVLENGYITEYGTHNELLSLSGTYAKLYGMQAEQYR